MLKWAGCFLTTPKAQAGEPPALPVAILSVTTGSFLERGDEDGVTAHKRQHPRLWGRV